MTKSAEEWADLYDGEGPAVLAALFAQAMEQARHDGIIEGILRAARAKGDQKETAGQKQ